LKDAKEFIKMFISTLNDYIAKEVRFTLPIFFKDIKVEHKSKFLAINYTLKKELYFYEVNSKYISSFGNPLKSIYFKNDYNSYNLAASSINKLVQNIFNAFDNDVNKKPKIDAITKTILKIPGAINDSNKLRSLFDELSSKVCEINAAFDTCAYQAYYLINQSVGMTNAPQDVQKTQLTSVLNDFWARDVCLFEEALLNLINNGKYNFVYYNYEFSECYKERNPRK
jgi:hypothetical protein